MPAIASQSTVDSITHRALAEYISLALNKHTDFLILLAAPNAHVQLDKHFEFNQSSCEGKKMETEIAEIELSFAANKKSIQCQKGISTNCVFAIFHQIKCNYTLNGATRALSSQETTEAKSS